MTNRVERKGDGYDSAAKAQTPVGDSVTNAVATMNCQKCGSVNFLYRRHFTGNKFFFRCIDCDTSHEGVSNASRC